MPRELTARERAFLTHYRGKARGNATQAAILAGYARNSARVTASRLLTKANIRAALQKRIETEEAKEKADAEERDALLSEIARNGDEDTYNRIAAVKELNKVDGRHVINVNLKAKVSLVEALGLSRTPEAAGEDV